MIVEQEMKVLAVEVFKALGNGSRLSIVKALSNGEKNVFEITQNLSIDMSTVSKHLSVLRNAGILSSRQEGNQRYYSVSLNCVFDFIECIEHDCNKLGS